eukprot:TRINITY_DN68779_c0_g1_i1.p1 TRINITY_DN68779_c0_g1~~TRINITY_DN68779_c0_g1_i1.p1  ORF type:complete len:285 (+),score=37.72 TRINITY_DN68779_c0_g1_i1:57-911(+)
MPCFAERQTELIGLVFSPWTLKTRWALVSSGVNFVFTEKPQLEWPLKVRLGIPLSGAGNGSDGKLTFPILVKQDGTLLRQTLSIVQWSQTEAAHSLHLGGATKQLWSEAIDTWDAKGTQMMRYGRLTGLNFAMADDAAAIEMIKILGLPIPGDGLKLRASRSVTQNMLNKYQSESDSTSEKQVIEYLEELQALLQAHPSWAALQRTGKLQPSGPYIIDGVFSYADISLVLGLHCLRPVKDFPLGLLRPLFGVATKDLAAKYEPLFVWSQAVVDAHFPAELKSSE